jgi:carbon-monoxide dehydrogenase small subunit
MADQGADQCGFCNPGFVMNVLAMERELEHPTEDEIRLYLSGNLCRCTGYMSQLRAIKAYLSWKREGAK